MNIELDLVLRANVTDEGIEISLCQDTNSYGARPISTVTITKEDILRLLGLTSDRSVRDREDDPRWG